MVHTPLNLNVCEGCGRNLRFDDLVFVKGGKYCCVCGGFVRQVYNKLYIKQTEIKAIPEAEKMFKYRKYSNVGIMHKELAARLGGRDFKSPHLPPLSEADRSAAGRDRYSRRKASLEARKNVQNLLNETRVPKGRQIQTIRGNSLPHCKRVQG